MEFSFSNRRFFTESEQQQRKEGVPLEEERTVLGMHPRGWYSKVVPIHHCDLISPAMNSVYLLFNLINCILFGTIKNLKVYIDILFCEGVVQDGHREKYLYFGYITKAMKEHVALFLKNGNLDCVRGILWVVTDRMNEVVWVRYEKVLYGRDDLYIEMSQNLI